jgi:hypothetical protein
MSDTLPFAICLGLTAAILYIGSAYRQMNLCKATIILILSPIAFFMVFETISVFSLAFYLLTNILVFKVLLTQGFLIVVACVAGFAALMQICNLAVDDKGEHIVQCV